jgi:quercetin dioxygenase-like cupin family protein
LVITCKASKPGRKHHKDEKEAQASCNGHLSFPFSVPCCANFLSNESQPNPARAFGASVTFEPGGRTAWHNHPLGQTLIVTAGCGLAQRWGGPIEEIRPGDVIWFPPGEKHWHGATATTAMTHIAILEQLDGKSADWMEKVSDEQYLGRNP